MDNHFADIILPLAVKGTFTYIIPDELTEKIVPGSRVLVQFGNTKLYSGIVAGIHDNTPSGINIRSVNRLLDPFPVVNAFQLKFWSWISDYYMCTIGEVMKAALPSDLCLEGVTSVPVPEKYKPREETFVKLARDFSEGELNIILDKLVKAPKQYNLLASYVDLSGYAPGMQVKPVRKSLLIKESSSSPASIEGLVRKKILTLYALETGRLTDTEFPAEPLKMLSEAQNIALYSITEIFRDKDISLLHGVTSSGKTEIYIHLIREMISQNKQVLYLLPGSDQAPVSGRRGYRSSHRQ